MQTEVLIKTDHDRFNHCFPLLEKRYLAFRINDDGQKQIIETPRQMFERIAKFLAKDETEFNHFFEMMYNLDALPNSPTLWGANMQKTLLSACAVLEVQDSTEDIMQQLYNGVILQKLGSGVGYYFGNIRAKKQIVSTSGGEALGVIAVKEIYNTAFERIQQGGRRRGAFMSILPVWHEEIFDFIQCKDDPSKLQMFNNSVGFIDEFMHAVENNLEFQLYSPISGKKIPTRKVMAREIWNAFLEQSHKNGEPSAIFLDTIQKKYPNVNATNPCSEALLEHKEFCNLGSINLMNHLRFDREGKPDMDWFKLRKTIKTMVILLNRVIDKNHYPDEEYHRQVFRNRKIGLGIMGFADLLIHHYKLKYSSPEARDLARRIVRYIREQAKRYSERYNFDNKALTSIAPTGSIARIAGVSTGIEPIYGKRTVHTSFEGLQFYDEINLDGTWVETAHDLSPMDHLLMVAAVANEVDMGMSKTINFSHGVTKEEIGEMYRMAWRQNITGITCYRDGSRKQQPLKKCEDDICEFHNNNASNDEDSVLIGAPFYKPNRICNSK